MEGQLLAVGVSSFCEHKEAAQRLISSCHAGLSPVFIATLTPSQTSPIENPAYSLEVARYKAIIEDQKGIIRRIKEQGGNPSEHEKELAYFERGLADSEKTLKYLLTAEELESAHQKMDCVYIPSDLHRAEDKSNLNTLFQQYNAGALTLDLFIEQADNTLRLLQAETK